MKTRIWALGLVLMMTLLVGASATTAEAASFTYTWDGCNGDTLCLFPVFGGTPDSIVWETFGTALPYEYRILDIAPPFDTCLSFSFAGSRDTILMHAWFAAVDSMIRVPVLSDIMVAIDDGRDVNENDSVLVNVLANDTTSSDTNVVVAPYNPVGNGPFNGTAYVDANMMVWYVPDPGYNGTDIFAYQVTNECGQADTAIVAITIVSDGILSITCDGALGWIDHLCNATCGSDCEEWPAGTISKGDSIRFCANVALSDLDELTAGWPVIDLPGWVGTNLPMERNPNDTTQFCWPGFEADSTPSWYVVPEGTLDIEGGIYDIVVRARSNIAPNNVSACTTTVDQAIDNNDPDLGAGEASWTLWQDVDSNGIVTTVDTMRLYIDLRNEPFEEICGVSVTLYGFPSTADTGILANSYCMYEIAGDNRWAIVLTGNDLAGDLEDVDGPFTAVFHYWDNACNEDSTSTQYNGPVDNTAPDCACIEYVYEAVDDLDDNGCIGLGELVRISVRDTCNGDVDAFYVDLFSDTTWRLGLGVNDETDSSHVRVLLPSIGGGWYGIEWELGKYPLANAIDTTAVEDVVPWVFLHAEDDAGNQLSCDSLPLVWTDDGTDIDARAPFPVQIDSCVEALTFTGRRAVHVYFTDTAEGAAVANFARLRMFYDNATGVIDYVDTLAGLNWDDTLGGGGTDGIYHVGPDQYYWTTDGTVDLSWCRDYLFAIWVIDDCGNMECVHGDSILCVGERPDPVVDLTCSPEDDLNICLEWTTYETSADSFHIYMASDGQCDTAIWVASLPFTDTGITYEWCTDDAGLALIEFRWYDFIVLTFDSCGNVQDEFPEDCENGEYSYVTRCFADMAPPVVCVFQPASLSPEEDTTIYSCDHCSPFIPGGPSDGMYIYTQPCNDTSLDVTSIDSVLVRIADSAGSFSDWYYAGFDSWQGPNHWVIRIDCEFLDDLVQTDDSVEVLQVMVISTDAAGRTSTREQVETCCGFFEFVWSAYYVDVYVNTVNGNVQTYQVYCGAHGFAVDGLNEVEICIEAGTPPYKIRMSAAPSGAQWADEFYHQVVYVENVYATCTTLTFSSEGWEKGLGELDVEVCDAAGHYSDETEIPLCVPDTIPPCALITNPVDAKCIRRSRSMIDPVQVCMTIDPAGIGLDNENILKVDFQWSQECCVGFVIDTICFDTACPPPPGFPEGSICTTFANPNNPFFGETRCYPTVGNPVACTVYAANNNLDSTICWTAQADTSCTITVCRLREVPCEDVFEWETFAIVPGHQIGNDYCVDWWNTEDLAWITESGTIIYLRAIVYDEQGNICYTPCVQVCVDIDTPPLCLWTPDVCPSNGYMAIGGNEDGDVTFVAELDLTQGNIDDLEDVTLWYKRSTDPDLLDYWVNVGSGFFGEYAFPGGTNSTVWRWDLNLYNLGLQDGISYDWRVQAHTIWGTHSYDYNGDGAFDHNTFDSSACDMSTYYIDLSAPFVAMDTVWTEVNGQLIVQPNVSCALSDPRGWAWTQFGNSLTVQPSVYPWTGQGPEYLNFKDDVKRVRWTLWDDSHNCECEDARGEQPWPSMSCFDEDCDCLDKGDQIPCDGFGEEKGLNGGGHWVVADLQGSNPMQNLTFNPADAPWWDDQWTGVQQAVLLVEVWDSCGNRSQDCITLYLLDADPTDAIIVEPMNDQVFCTAPGGDAFGGIEIRSAAILEEGWNKAVYAYRAVGATEWIEFDSVGVPQDEDQTWQTFWSSVYWNPVAMGLPDGSYELTVWAVDNALNRSENLYIITVHLSCAAPTVALVYPTSTDPAFIGCPIELEAIAESSDPRNPIVQVDFYYVRVIDDLGESNYIGSDYFSVDGRWGYFWDEPDFEGPHYIYAIAENLAGQTTMSELVWVKGDDTDPWSVVTQVGDDISNGGSGDPTVLQHSTTVTLYGNAYDNQADWGYGEVDNCGVDSVMFYVRNSNGTIVAGFLATPDNIIDSSFTAEWTIAGDFPAGTYRVFMRAFDCACNEGDSDYWYVRIAGPDQDLAISVDGPEICGYPSVDEEMDVTVTVSDPEFVDYVYVAWSNTIYSDVQDRYEWQQIYSENEDGVFTGTVNTALLDEGVYRLRAVIYYTDGSSTENGFDDFTFDESLGHHMLVRVDHSVTPLTIMPVGGETFRAHDDICFVVDAVEECDIDQLFYCEIEGSQSPTGNEAENPLSFCFDPVDSSCVTLNNCGVWSGEITFLVTDALGHTSVVGSQVWILDVAGPDTTLIVSPSFGDFITPTSNNVLTARKLSGSGVDSVQFYRSATQGGAGTYIGSAVAVGDEFSYEWNVENVAEGSYYLYTRSFNNNAGKDGPHCVSVTVAKACSPFALMTPNPSHERTINGTTFTFVGEHADLCVDRAVISNYTAVGIDSIVWGFRNVDAPGVTIEDNLDPNLGWVRINSDTYGSLCVDWFTNWCEVIAQYDLEGEYGYEGDCCSDGQYAVVAWVYDRAGNVCHSNPMNVVIDVTDPYSEIVDIDGDETFGTCHEVVLPDDEVVKFSAVAIDDKSCAGSQPFTAGNAGAKYLQFFVGECGGGGGCVDVVFVVDGSGSMGDDQEAIATNAAIFFEGLGNVDFRLGVLGYGDTYHPVSTGGQLGTSGPGTGQFTTDQATFGTMVTAVGTQLSGTENGLTAMNEALTSYPFRSNCQKVLVLVTDEDADDFADYASLFPPLVNSGAAIFGVISFGDSAGYSQIGTATGGDLFDIEANWGANLAAVASQIQGLAGGGANDVGVVWGETVTLTDGQDNAFALWNPTGLEPGEYCAWTVVIDNVGNSYVSDAREICIVDKTPPVAHITGFGKSTDEHMVNKYTIYGATWDNDVDYVQFQYRPTGSTNATDWTGIGISSKVNDDSTCWMATWNPCVLSGSFDLRVVPTDKNGNQDFSVQPIATVTLADCNVTPSGGSTSDATIWFEDRTFDDLGLVHVDQDNTSDDFHNMMMAVWADMTGDLTVEKIELWAPDPDLPSWKSGSFDGSDAIKMGGEGWFWQSYTDASNRTHLKREIMTVWRVKAAIGACNSTHPTLGAKVCIEPGALSADNGIVVFPSRIPTLNLSQQHFQAWPAYEGSRFPLVSAIRLTNEVEGFNTGKYARVTIRYADQSLVSSNLGVAWWDGDEWNASEGLIAGGEIGSGSATFHSMNLYGLYAVVSAGRVCNSGAITVENAGAEKKVGNILGPRPTIYTRVRSNIEFNNENKDIDPDAITVVLDGNVTLYANGENPDNDWYTSDWDPVTGILTTEWNWDAPKLTEGTHTLMVQAFSKTGYCSENTYTFSVDATPPNVVVTGYEDCANPTFFIQITDAGAGVKWEKVFIDVYDVTGSEYSVVPKDKLIHTESYDAFNEDLDMETGEFSFQLVDHIAQGRRLRIVIYDGNRSEYVSDECGCVTILYDHPNDGVEDAVGNHTQIVEEDYTIWGGSCTGGGGGDGSGDVTIQVGNGSSNPFDPWAGGSITFNLNGFDGGGSVSVGVYDVAGVKVADLSPGTVSSTVGTVVWNGRNEDGEYVAQGVYLVHFATTGGQAAGPSSQVLKVVVKRGSTAGN